MSLLATAAGEGASDELVFYVNGRRIVEKNADPEQMMLSYLRKRLRVTGTKYGCGGGGCGACTVMISRYEPVAKKIIHYSANACLLPLCSLYGCAVVTVEGIGSTKTRIHPVQERIAKSHGSQCGFCTPGMVMSIYALLRNETEPSTEQIAEALSGNLCRCTGYRPIIDGSKTFCRESICCQNKENRGCCLEEEECLPSLPNKERKICTGLFSAKEFQPLDPTQELIFPPELMKMAECQTAQTLVFRGERTTWISPVNFKELLELKAKYPLAPLVVGNTCVGPDMKFRGVFHPLILSPSRILDLHVVKHTEEEAYLTWGQRKTTDFLKYRDIIKKDGEIKMLQELQQERRNLNWFTFHQMISHMREDCGKETSTKKLTEFEDIIINSKEHLLSKIYALLLQFDTESEQVKNCMIKWMQNIGHMIPMGQWEKLWKKQVKFSASQDVRENWYKMFYRWYLSPKELQKMFKQQHM